MADFEIVVIGGGVVGLAIADRLSQRHPSLVVLERNDKYGMETSSRNSEVIHAGIYYIPGSLKARLCVEGREDLYALCERYAIPFRPMTKIISATVPSELQKLEQVRANAEMNGVILEPLTKEQVRQLEPNVCTAGGLFSPRTGVISVHDLMDFFYRRILDNRGMVQPRCRATHIEKINADYRVHFQENGIDTSVDTEVVINAAGLDSDTVAASLGIDIDQAGYRLHYVKGSYFSIVPSKAGLLKRLVYPVPGNEGLGVHARLDWGGRLKFGPDVEYLPDRTLDYRVDERKRSAFAESIRRILPMITDDDIVPDMSGIRPKLQEQGKSVRDFVIVHEIERGYPGFVNLIGIESPGLTSSPAIARFVAELLGFENH
jgi:L-2-hydroxyglutarate oxidase LhgO